MKTHTENTAAEQAHRNTQLEEQGRKLYETETTAIVDNRASALTTQRLQHMANGSSRRVQLEQQATLSSASPRSEKIQDYQKIADDSAQATQLKQRADVMAGASPTLIQDTKKPNETGLPDQLKSGIEAISGRSMDHVKVHYNSDKPAQLQAHAYAQGSEIHVGPGQEKHLPHEAWHVVQQLEGRVKPTMQAHGNTLINNDVALETEANVKGEAAIKQAEHRSVSPDRKASNINIVPTPEKTVQRLESQSITPDKIIQLTTKKKKHPTAKYQQEKEDEQKKPKEKLDKKQAAKQEKTGEEKRISAALAARKEQKKTHAKQAAVRTPTFAAASAADSTSPPERTSADDPSDSDGDREHDHDYDYDYDHEEDERKEDVRDDESKKSKPAPNLNELLKTGADLLVDGKDTKIYIDVDQSKHQPKGFPIGSRVGEGTKFSPMLQPTAEWHANNTAPALKTWADKNLGTKGNGEFPGPGQANQLEGIHYEAKCVRIDGVLYIFYHCYPDPNDRGKVDNPRAQQEWKKKQNGMKLAEAKKKKQNARSSQSRNKQVKNAENTDEVKKPSSSSGQGK